MRIRPTLLLVACLSVVPIQSSLAQTPDKKLTQDLSQFLCQHLKAGDRFDVAMFRAMADLAARDESFALMVAGGQDRSGEQIAEQAGEKAGELCPTEMVASFDRMSPRLRKAYGL